MPKPKTINFDDEISDLIENQAEKEGVSFSSMVNKILREGKSNGHKTLKDYKEEAAVLEEELEAKYRIIQSFIEKEVNKKRKEIAEQEEKVQMEIKQNKEKVKNFEKIFKEYKVFNQVKELTLKDNKGINDVAEILFSSSAGVGIWQIKQYLRLKKEL